MASLSPDRTQAATACVDHVTLKDVNHAEDFRRRYAEDLQILAGQAMMDLGIPDDQMGARDPDRNRERHSFFPSERTGGSVSPAGRVTLDSGLMNPDLLVRQTANNGP
jgi:hypothetical protein